MAEKIKVYNRACYDVGVRTISGIEYNIRPSSFIPLELTDIEKLAAETNLFNSGALQVEEQHKEEIELGIEDKEAPQFMADAEIHAILEKKGAAGTKELKALLEKAKEPFVRQKIYDMANALDLSASKMKLIQEYIPELFIEV